MSAYTLWLATPQLGQCKRDVRKLSPSGAHRAASALCSELFAPALEIWFDPKHTKHQHANPRSGVFCTSAWPSLGTGAPACSKRPRSDSRSAHAKVKRQRRPLVATAAVSRAIEGLPQRPRPYNRHFKSIPPSWRQLGCSLARHVARKRVHDTRIP